MTARLHGLLAERKAERFLTRAGFRLIQRNYTTRLGEIDLIMQKDDLVIFVEVRMRKSIRFGTGADSVNWGKQQKLIRTAQLFLQQYQTGNESFRFDVVSISADGIDWIPDAFNLD